MTRPTYDRADSWKGEPTVLQATTAQPQHTMPDQGLHNGFGRAGAALIPHISHTVGYVSLSTNAWPWPEPSA